MDRFTFGQTPSDIIIPRWGTDEQVDRGEEMSELNRKVGQMLCIGFEGQEFGPELRSLLKEVQPGGVIFFQRNIAFEDQFRRLVADIHERLKATRPFLAIDQEGGQVDRFRELLGPLPSAQDAAQAGMSFELGYTAGRELAAFGLNVDFAPVLDVDSQASRSVLGTRTAGASAEEITLFAAAFLRGLSSWNVVGCGKHFPGLGGGGKDSHIGMPVIEKSEEELWNVDLKPYDPSTIRYPMVMIAHAWYPALERSLASDGSSSSHPIPASLSPNIVQGLLRRRIGYEGLVVSDDLEMGGVLEGRTIGEAAVQAVRAGCDVLLSCRYAENVQQVHAAVVKAAEDDSNLRDQIDQAAANIARLKDSMAAERESEAVKFTRVEMLQRDIRLLSDAVRSRLAGQATKGVAQA
jgi:beta-N-acetylhexosaminidase